MGFRFSEDSVVIKTPYKGDFRSSEANVHSTPYSTKRKDGRREGNHQEKMLAINADDVLRDTEESFLQDFVTGKENGNDVLELEEDKGARLPFQIISREVEEDKKKRLNTGSYDKCQYGNLEDERRAISDEKCTASVSQLKLLRGNKCQEKDCPASISTMQHSVIGLCLKLVWYCSVGHRGYWYSSLIYASGLAFKYIVNVGLLLSGG